MAAVVKTQIAQSPKTSAHPGARFFFDELLFRVPSVNLNEICRYFRFVPVIVLVPESTANNRVAPREYTLPGTSIEAAGTTKLFEAFRKAAERIKNTSAESTFVFGDATVNFATMEAVRKGKPIELTTLEFKTLKYLIENPGRVVSRDELLDRVWGYQNYPCTRTVDNRILILRQKLERDPSRPVHFRTVRGAGYKFSP